MRTFAVSVAVLAALAMAPAAFAEPGQNGPPGPEGNPNQPAEPAPGPPAAPPGSSGSNPHGGPPGITGNPPQTPAAPADQGNGGSGGRTSHPTPSPSANGAEHSAPNSAASQGEPQGPPEDVPVANGVDGTNPGGGPDGWITICHATGSETNPFVEITISVNGLNGHGDHQDGGDIVPAPAGGCEGVTPVTTETTAGGDAGDGAGSGGGDEPGLSTRDGSGGPVFEPGLGYSGVLGAVLSESASGSADTAAETELAKAGFDGSAEANEAGDAVGGDSLPFTGMTLGGLALFGLLALCGGVALWRVTRSRPDSV
jgi:hypothetical protein